MFLYCKSLHFAPPRSDDKGVPKGHDKLTTITHILIQKIEKKKHTSINFVFYFFIFSIFFI